MSKIGRDDRSEILQRFRPYDSVRALFSSEQAGHEALNPAGKTAKNSARASPARKNTK
ncbi:MAG: hypothetical protein HY942_06005 [Gammaproteobacteria bacterium]|nr:hypothetical protein [Gammaproteobacteria bacterium]